MKCAQPFNSVQSHGWTYPVAERSVATMSQPPLEHFSNSELDPRAARPSSALDMMYIENSCYQSQHQNTDLTFDASNAMGDQNVSNVHNVGFEYGNSVQGVHELTELSSNQSTGGWEPMCLPAHPSMTMRNVRRPHTGQGCVVRDFARFNSAVMGTTRGHPGEQKSSVKDMEGLPTGRDLRINQFDRRGGGMMGYQYNMKNPRSVAHSRVGEFRMRQVSGHGVDRNRNTYRYDCQYPSHQDMGDQLHYNGDGQLNHNNLVNGCVSERSCSNHSRDLCTTGSNNLQAVCHNKWNSGNVNVRGCNNVMMTQNGQYNDQSYVDMQRDDSGYRSACISGLYADHGRLARLQENSVHGLATVSSKSSQDTVVDSSDQVGAGARTNEEISGSVSQNVATNVEDDLTQSARIVEEPISVPDRGKVYNLYKWIIKPVPGTISICVEGKTSLTEELYWHSGAITRRVTEKAVESCSGSLYKLHGNMELLEAMFAGISRKTAEAFRLGFPPDWEQQVAEHFNSIAPDGSACSEHSDEEDSDISIIDIESDIETAETGAHSNAESESPELGNGNKVAVRVDEYNLQQTRTQVEKDDKQPGSQVILNSDQPRGQVILNSDQPRGQVNRDSHQLRGQITSSTQQFKDQVTSSSHQSKGQADSSSQRPRVQSKHDNRLGSTLVERPIRSSAPSRGTLQEEGMKVLTDWIIKPLPKNTGIQVQGMRNGKLWLSTAIQDRIHPKTLLSVTGAMYKLRGNMDQLLARDAGLPSVIIARFRSGFPTDWLELIQEHIYSTTKVPKDVDDETNDTRLQSQQAARNKKGQNQTTRVSKNSSDNETRSRLSRSKLTERQHDMHTTVSKTRKKTEDKNSDIGKPKREMEAKGRKSNNKIGARSKSSQSSLGTNHRSHRQDDTIECKGQVDRKKEAWPDSGVGQDPSEVFTPSGDKVDLTSLIRSKSGRLIKPPLMQWVGQRLVEEDGVLKAVSWSRTSSAFISQFNQEYRKVSKRQQRVWRFGSKREGESLLSVTAEEPETVTKLVDSGSKRSGNKKEENSMQPRRKAYVQVTEPIETGIGQRRRAKASTEQRIMPDQEKLCNDVEQVQTGRKTTNLRDSVCDQAEESSEMTVQRRRRIVIPAEQRAVSEHKKLYDNVQLLQPRIRNRSMGQRNSGKSGSGQVAELTKTTLTRRRRTKTVAQQRDLSKDDSTHGEDHNQQTLPRDRIDDKQTVSDGSQRRHMRRCRSDGEHKQASRPVPQSNRDKPLVERLQLGKGLTIQSSEAESEQSQPSKRVTRRSLYGANAAQTKSSSETVMKQTHVPGKSAVSRKHGRIRGKDTSDGVSDCVSNDSGTNPEGLNYAGNSPELPGLETEILGVLDSVRTRSAEKKLQMKQQLSGGVGTRKRRRALHELMNQHNKDHEDDLYDATPFRSKKSEKVMMIEGSNDDSIFAAVAQRQGLAGFRTPVADGSGRSQAALTFPSGKKTPSCSEAFLDINGCNNDGYIHNVGKRIVANRKRKLRSRDNRESAKKPKVTKAQPMEVLKKHLTYSIGKEELQSGETSEEEDHYWETG